MGQINYHYGCKKLSEKLDERFKDLFFSYSQHHAIEKVYIYAKVEDKSFWADKSGLKTVRVGTIDLYPRNKLVIYDESFITDMVIDIISKLTEIEDVVIV